MDYKQIIGGIGVIVIATFAFIKANKELKNVEKRIDRNKLMIMLVILYLVSLIYALGIFLKK